MDLIVISQSDVVNYAEYSKIPLDRLSLCSELIYPRMIHYQGGFRSHLDVLNKIRRGVFWNEADFVQRRELLNIWNLPGFVGVHLANYLRQFGIGTGIINNFDAEWDLFCEMYERSSMPPLIGISCTFHLNYSEVGRISKKIKSRFPDASIVIGGAFVNAQVKSDDSAALERAMLRLGLDYAIHSFNSESDLRDLVLARKHAGASLSEVNNLFFREKINDSAQIQKTVTRWNDPVLDDAPADWDRLDLTSFVRSTLQLRSASGCAFSCAFCSYPRLSKGLHTMSLDVLEKHLISISRIPGVRRLVFLDDTFNVPAERFRSICRLLSKFDFEWSSFLRVQYVDAETAALMKDSGCSCVYLGIESANDSVLKSMNKRANGDAFRRGVGHLRNNGIVSLAAFVLGFPGETDETVLSNIDFVNSTGVEFYSLKEFYYSENTPVHEQRDAFGLAGAGNKWSHRTMDSRRAYEHKIAAFSEIKNSVFIDPDTSLWFLAYMLDQGFSFADISEIQRNLNGIMLSQIQGAFDDNHTGFRNLATKLNGVGGTA